MATRSSWRPSGPMQRLAAGTVRRAATTLRHFGLMNQLAGSTSATEDESRRPALRPRRVAAPAVHHGTYIFRSLALVLKRLRVAQKSVRVAAPGARSQWGSFHSHRIEPRLDELKCDSRCESQLRKCDSQTRKVRLATFGGASGTFFCATGRFFLCDWQF